MKMLITTLFLLSFATNIFSTTATICRSAAEYSECSINKECRCLQYSNTTENLGICGLTSLKCSTMKPCLSNSKTCHDNKHICIRHPLCDFRPLCYPLNKATHEICPPYNTTLTTTSRPSPSTTSMKPFHPSCDWTRDGNIVLSQLKNPTGLYLEVNEDASIYVVDSGNHRIVQWTPEQAINSPTVISANGTNQLLYPRDIVINKKDGAMFICDKGNRRIVKWLNNSKDSHTLISNIECESLLIDDHGSLIVAEFDKDRVTKWEKNDKGQSSVKAIAGAYGKGSNLNQLNQPRNIFMDEKDQSIYVSDSGNHRIVKWLKGAKEGIIVAGGNGRGNGTHQLAFPRGLVLHPNGDLYIADTSNHRIVRWTQGATSGTVIVTGIPEDSRQQLTEPFDLIFDQNYRNIYVTDWTNSRLLRFFIDGVGNCVTIT